jgi:Single-stranded DNA-binding replication protein A (RPA), large (70 kD) subunit and related ssDNA-binding proteins
MTDMNQTEIGNISEISNISEMRSNSSDDLEDRIRTIQKTLSENGADVSVEEIETKLNELINVYKVQPAEAQRSTINSFLKKYNISKTKIYADRGAAVTKKIEDISAMADTPDTWVNFSGKIVQIWENNHDSIAQAGLVGDETGTIKFTLWNTAGVFPLELNKTYDFKNAVVKAWNGKANVGLTKAVSIHLSENEIENVKLEKSAGEFKERTNELRTVSQLNRDGMWTDLKVQIVQLFENTHESIAFAGIFGDETGTARFTVWKTTEIQKIEVGKTYSISNALVKEWNGNFSVDINRAAKVEESDEEIIAKPTVFEICGCAVDIQAGSGLIRRCPECNKVMTKGICTEHGKVKGKYDLRIKSVLDDGNEAHEVIINCQLAQNLIGISLEEAVMMTTETLDPECVNDYIKKEFIGKYYTAKGVKIDRYIIAESIENAEAVTTESIQLLKDLIKEELAREEIKEEIKGEIEEIENEFGIEDDSKSSELEEFEKMLESMDDCEVI